MDGRFSADPESLSRRLWLGGAAFLGLALALAAPSRAPRAASQAEPIAQPDAPGPRAFMDRAFALRRRAEADGDQPDPTAHAEMEAIRDAARRLGRRDLAASTLYASSRTCPMCEAAAYWAGIDRMIHGASLADAGAPRLGR